MSGTTQHFLRGLMLMQQGRIEPAVQEFRRHLVEEPSDAHAHAQLAVSLAQLKRYDEATEHARRAVGLAPDEPDTHFALARVMYDRNHYPEAKAAAEEALRLDPENPWYHYLRGGIAADEHRWREALADADAGLALDPEHESCLNLKALCLVKLGRTEQAATTLDAALRRNPDSPRTHAGQGWRLLEGGRHKEAMEHFREALRLDPELDTARAGMVEAMKARHLVYRVFLKYLSWMSRLTSRTQWIIIIGAFFAFRWVDGLYRENPERYGWLMPVLALYIGFALLTWFAVPLFNLLLRLSRFGRLVLSPEQRRGSTLFGLGLLVVIGLAAWWLTAFLSGDENTAFIAGDVAFKAGLLLIPLSTVYIVPAGQRRLMMSAVVVGLAVLLLIRLGLFFQALDLWDANRKAAEDAVHRADMFGTLFILGIIGSQFLANHLNTTRPRL